MSNETESADLRRTMQRIGRRVQFRLRRFQFDLHLLIPVIVPNPYSSRKAIQLHREKDAEENAETTLGEGDSIRSFSIWAVEFYTPSTIPQLRSYLKRFGWEELHHWGRSPLEWVERTRTSWIAGGYTNLGHITREKGSWRFPVHTQSRSLPRCFSSAHATIISVTPSLSALALEFQLADEERTSFEEILATHHETQLRARRGYSTSIHNPEHLKREAITNKRKAWRREIHAWLKRNLPGSFVGFDAYHPCLETAEYASAPDSSIRSPVLDLVYPRLNWNGWSSEDPPLTLLMATGFDDDEEEWYGSITVHRPDIEKVDLDGYGGNGADAFFARFERTCSFLVVRYGLNALLAEFRETAASLRDESFKPVSALRRSGARTELLRYWQQLTDIMNVSNDLQTSPDYINQNCPKFRPIEERDRERELVHLLDESGREQTLAVIRQIETTSRIRSDLNNAYAIFETKSANRFMQLLTLANLLLATVALLAAAASAFFAWQALPSETQTSILSRIRG